MLLATVLMKDALDGLAAGTCASKNLRHIESWRIYNVGLRNSNDFAKNEFFLTSNRPMCPFLVAWSKPRFLGYVLALALLAYAVIHGGYRLARGGLGGTAGT